MKFILIIGKIFVLRFIILNFNSAFLEISNSQQQQKIKDISQIFLIKIIKFDAISLLKFAI